jgi:glycosyltransferase involved in cell wall biosynthesis
LQKRVWITWERQRRSIELAKKFHCELFIIEDEGIMKYPLSLLKTVMILQRTKPDILFVQNPSMILATFACLYKLIRNVKVVVDRHTTFLLTRKYKNTPRIILFKLLHRFTIRKADLTIVTNDFLADLVQKLNGRSFVLPDKLPELSNDKQITFQGKRNILLISSFGIDEPIQEAIESMKSLIEEDTYLYITGNFKKLEKSIYEKVPRNVIFTGYLGEQQFIDTLFSVDAVMVLTTADHCMLCGCYESVAAEKPLITSEKKVLTEYFKGAVFVRNSPKEITVGIRELINNKDLYQSKIVKLKHELTSEWEKQFSDLEKQLASKS